MNKTMNKTQKRTFFKKRQRLGDVTKLVEFFDGKYSQPHISNVLAGRRNNEEILDKAYKVTSRRKVLA